jgi:hypothetical protein
MPGFVGDGAPRRHFRIEMQLDVGEPERRKRLANVALDRFAQRAGGRRERDDQGDAVAAQARQLHHAERHDVLVQLRVDHPAQGFDDGFARWFGHFEGILSIGEVGAARRESVKIHHRPRQHDGQTKPPKSVVDEGSGSALVATVGVFANRGPVSRPRFSRYFSPRVCEFPCSINDFNKAIALSHLLTAGYNLRLAARAVQRYLWPRAARSCSGRREAVGATRWVARLSNARVE